MLFILIGSSSPNSQGVNTRDQMLMPWQLNLDADGKQAFPCVPTELCWFHAAPKFSTSFLL